MHQEVRGSVGGQRDGWVDRGVVKRIWQTVNIGSGVAASRGLTEGLFQVFICILGKFHDKIPGEVCRAPLTAPAQLQKQLLTPVPAAFLCRFPLWNDANVSSFREDHLCCEDFRISVEGPRCLKDRKLLVRRRPAAGTWRSQRLLNASC